MAEKAFSKAPMSAQGEAVKAYMATYQGGGNYEFAIVAPTLRRLEGEWRHSIGRKLDRERVEEVYIFQAKDCEANS